MSEPLRLYTFALSHFSEKVRWLLDASGTRYEEIALTPFLHVPRTLWMGGGRATTVPVIDVDGEKVQDSARILQWLSVHRAPFALLPPEHEDPAARAKILDIEKRFNRVGSHLIRFVYSEALASPTIPKLWTVESGPVVAAIVQNAFPLLRGIARRSFAITPDNVARSRRTLDEGMTWLEAEIADGRTYLVGDTLTAADITAAALLAPLACPDQHPVYSREDFRALGAAQLKPWSGRPALEWVRARYREDRRFAAARTQAA